MSRRLKIFLYACFTFAAIFFSALVTFPYGALDRRLETMAAQAMPGATLVIDRTGPALPFGLKLSGITFTLPEQGGKPGAAIHVDHLRVTPAWTKLLTFQPAIAFSVGALGGEATGFAAIGRKTRHLDLKVDSKKPLHIEDDGLLEKLTGFQIVGAVSGHVAVNLNEAGTISSGTVEAQIDGAHLKGGKVMGFPLPATDFGTPEFAMSIDKGHGKIDRFEIKSPDITGDIKGEVTFRPYLGQSLIHGQIKAKLSQAWFGRNPAIHQLMGFSSPFSKPDGTVTLPLNGPLMRPIAIPMLGGFGR